MIAKMKSLCASGSQDHFSRLAPRPTPHQPPSARAYLPWMAWKQVLHWSEQVPVSQAWIRAIRLGELRAEGQREHGHGAGGRDEHPRRRPGREQHGGQDQEQDQAGAQVVTGQHQADHDQAHREDDRHDDVGQLDSELRLRLSTVAAHRTNASLAASDGCSRWPREGEPVAVAVDADTRAG